MAGNHVMGRRKRKGRVLMALGLVCLLVGFGIAALYLYEDWQAGNESRSALAQMDSASAQLGEGDGVLVIDGREYLGCLQVPSVGVELPVLAEFDGMADLDIAPCRYSGSPYTNDLVIAGHNYRSHFRPLLDVGIGDDVYLVTASKKKLRYQVVSVETLQPTAIEDMVDSSYDLSLFTCTNDSMARWTVRCMRVY